MGLFDSLKRVAGAKAPAPVQPAPANAPAITPPSPPPPGPVPAATEVTSGEPAAPGSTRRLLFVGCEDSWLNQIERDLAGLQPAWKCSRVAVASEAIKEWAAGAFDTLIIDSKADPGAQLPVTLEKELAQCLCFARCQMVDRATSVKWATTKASLLAADSTAATLVSTIKRSARIQTWMADRAIHQLVTQIHKLPTQHRLYNQVADELQSETGSLDVVGKLIAQEPVMSAKILQVVNSAFFGLPGEISDPTESVMVLGAERIKALILLAGVFSQYAASRCPGFSPEPIWTHCIRTGVFARAIAMGETKNSRTAETAFTAGLLHDIGKLVLAGNLPERYSAVQRHKVSKKITSREAEMEILGASHAEVGACLLATWALPLPILETLAWHHEPARSEERGFTPLAAVHAANAFTQEDLGDQVARDQIDLEYLQRSGLGDCRNRWREFCGLEPKLCDAAA